MPKFNALGLRHSDRIRVHRVLMTLVAALVAATAGGAPATLADQCAQARIEAAEAQANKYETWIAQCEKERDAIKAELDGIKRRPPALATPALPTGDLDGLREGVRRLARRVATGDRTLKLDTIADLAAAAGAIEADIGIVLDERSSLRASVTAMADELRRFREDKEAAVRKAASAVDGVIARFRCGIVQRSASGAIAGVVGTAKEAEALKAEIDRIAPGATLDVKALGARLCLERLSGDWYAARIATGSDDSFRDVGYDVERQQDLDKLIPYLPDSRDVCSEATAAALAQPEAAARLGLGNDPVSIWAQDNGSLRHCENHQPRDATGWRMRGGIGSDKTALLLLRISIGKSE